MGLAGQRRIERVEALRSLEQRPQCVCSASAREGDLRPKPLEASTVERVER